jgi:hypothetical protein
VVLDSKLLAQARSAGAQHEEAERQALLTRADYHTAIRRLHLAGGSLREIAHALSLSHQRVQQIVSGAGGTWWSRFWDTRSKPDAVCTWCGRPPGEVSKLIAGPRVYICDACVEAAEGTASRGPTSRSSGPFERPQRKRPLLRCAFCSKRSTGTRQILTAPSGNVCTDCLRTCREILDGRAQA